MKMFFLAPLFAFAVTSCAVFDGAQEKIVQGVNTYCATMTQSERLLVRQYVNENSPHTVAVTCEGDT